MKAWVCYLLLGAAGFWGPEIILTMATRHPVNPKLLTALLPLSLCVVYGTVLRSRRKTSAGPSVAVVMLMGIFFFGPWCMTLAAAFSGSGGGGPWQTYLWLPVFSLLPFYTLMMSVYDVSFFALGLVTFFLVAAHFRWERHHWVLPFRRNRLGHVC